MSDFPTKDMYTRNLYISEFRTKNCIRELIYEKSIKENIKKYGYDYTLIALTDLVNHNHYKRRYQI